jgi:hypothetical protein
VLAVGEPLRIGSIEVARLYPNAMINPDGEVFYPDSDADAAWFRVEHGARPIIAVGGPAWDGEGVDPWLPERLADQVEVVAAEVAVREALWAELSAWIVTVNRAVLRSVRPDPTAVWSTVADWSAAVQRVVRGPIRETIGKVYEPLLGRGYRFDSRPAVVEHLSMVTNRMVRTPDAVFDLVSSQIAKGANLGESIPELADRVDEVLSTTRTERWPNRATVVARTETLSALNAGRDDAFGAVAEELEQPFEKMWLATIDGRTRPTHRRADQQRVPVDGTFQVGGAALRRPGDPLGPGKEIIQCRCTMLLLEPGETVDLSHRQFKDY